MTDSSGRRVVGVARGGGLGEQQVPAHQQPDQVDRRLVEAHPRRRSRARSARRRRCARSARPCRCRGAGRRPSARRAATTWRISADASMQVSTTCRSTVKRWIAEACGSSRTRSHSGSTASRAPVSSRVSQTAEQAGPGREQPHQQACRASAGHGSRQRPAPRATSRAAVAGASTRSRSAASAAAAQQQQAGPSAAGRPAVEHDLAAGEGDARRDGLQAGPPGRAVGLGRAARRRRGARSAGTGG